MRRLLILSTEFPPGPGGIGTHAFSLAKHLQRRGWAVAVLSPQDYTSTEEIQEFNRDHPFPIRRLRHLPWMPVEGLYRLAVLAHWLRRWRPDVILATGAQSVWLMASVSRWVRVPWLAVGHGTEFGVTHPRERWLTRWAFGRADGVVCVSQFTRQQMKRIGAQPKSVWVIPNGAEAERFRRLSNGEIRSFRKSLGLEKAFLLLTVGNVTRRKGQDIVVKALSLVLQEAPHVHYLIVGLPTLGERLLQMASELGVQDNVHLLGRLDDTTLVQAYNACDLFVMTSRYTRDGDFEGYGIAVVEAALCGKPAVVSGDSGLAEAVIDGETGLVVSPEDPEATAAAILQLVRDPELRTRMGQAAYRRARDEQTWERRAAEYEAVLLGILRRKREKIS